MKWMSTRCDMQSLIVWMIAGTAMAERETVRREMRRWSELSAIVITLVELFVCEGEGGLLCASHLAEQEKHEWVQVKGHKIPYWQ